MAVYNKGMSASFSLTGSGVAVNTDYQPPSGKMWWFTALRFALSAGWNGNGSSVSISTVNPAIVQRTWISNSFQTISDSGELSSSGIVATNTTYIRISHTIGSGVVFTGAFFWFGLEIDV